MKFKVYSNIAIKFFTALILVSALTLTNCRKKQLEKKYVYTDKPMHCFNLTLDADEVFTDAGGSCGCNDEYRLIDFCNSPNTVSVNNIDYPVDKVTVDTPSSTEFTFQIHFNSTDIISLSVLKNVYFNQELTSTGGSPSEPDDVRASLVSNSYGNRDLTYGKFEIKSNGCDFTFNSCNTAFPFGFSGTIPVKFNATIKKINR